MKILYEIREVMSFLLEIDVNWYIPWKNVVNNYIIGMLDKGECSWSRNITDYHTQARIVAPREKAQRWLIRVCSGKSYPMRVNLKGMVRHPLFLHFCFKYIWWLWLNNTRRAIVAAIRSLSLGILEWQNSFESRTNTDGHAKLEEPRCGAWP